MNAPHLAGLALALAALVACGGDDECSIAAIQAELYWLAVIGVLASVVGAYYYLRIIKIMWFDDPAPQFAPVAGELKLVYGLSGLFILAYVLVASPLGTAADVAAGTFF